jgi:hypothetical protein
MNTRPLSSDFKEALRFLDALDPSASRFTFVTADDDRGRSDPTLTKTLHGSFSEYWSTLRDLNAAGTGVYVTINTPDRVRAAFVDLAGLPLPAKYNFAPQIVVEAAPRRYNLYWLMHGLCPVNQFATVQQALFEHHNRSAADCDLARVMRLPGFCSYTIFGAFRVRVVTLITDESELADELYVEDELDRKEERARMIAEAREAEDE